jgi:hypothetical protein
VDILRERKGVMFCVCVYWVVEILNVRKYIMLRLCRGKRIY